MTATVISKGSNHPFYLAAAAFLIVAILSIAPPASGIAPEGELREWTLPSDETIEALLAERMANNGVGIVAAIIDSSGERIFSYGRSGAANGRSLDGDTVFQIGSLTKPFTNLLLAEMVLRGEVELDDPAEKYLSRAIRMPQKGRQITLRDLAEHVSGLPRMPDNFDLNGDPNPFEAYTVDDLHRFLTNFTPEREPGAREMYSNVGVALLGRLLGNRVATDYEALLTERVLAPLGMTSTSITLSRDQERRLAPGHDLYLYPVNTWEMKALPGSGSLRSTANDMLRLVAAYLGYRKTPLDSAIQMQLDQSLGWMDRTNGIFSHSGGKAGYRSGVAFDTNTGVGAVVLANARTYDKPIDIALHIVAGEPLDPPAHAPRSEVRVSLPHEILDRYVGRYRHRSGQELLLARYGHHLLVQYPSGSILEFAAVRRHEFFYTGGNDDIMIDVDSQGQVTGLKLYGNGKTFETGGKQYQRVDEM